jgi:hypothetical protein
MKIGYKPCFVPKAIHVDSESGKFYACSDFEDHTHRYWLVAWACGVEQYITFKKHATELRQLANILNNI